MTVNRRNTLIGLGTIVAGGGAALGTGAFSQVEAERTVHIGTTEDAEALLGLDVTGALAGEGDDDTISFDLDEDLNRHATTRFDSAFTITNNSGNNVNVTIHSDGKDRDHLDTDEAMHFEPVEKSTSTNDGLSEVEISAGSENPETFNVVFDLEDGSALPDDGDNITIEANEISNS